MLSSAYDGAAFLASYIIKLIDRIVKDSVHSYDSFLMTYMFLKLNSGTMTQQVQANSIFISVSSTLQQSKWLPLSTSRIV